MTVAGIRYARRFYTGHIHMEYASLLAFFSPDFKRTFYSAFVKLDVLFYPEAAQGGIHSGRGRAPCQVSVAIRRGRPGNARAE